MAIDSCEIDVPLGFTEQHDWYGEGLLTSLVYSDGTVITLHSGFLVRFSATENLDAEEYPSPTGRGRVLFGITERDDRDRAWGAYLGVYGMAVNVLFESAPLTRRSLFASALASVRLHASVNEPGGSFTD